MSARVFDIVNRKLRVGERRVVRALLGEIIRLPRGGSLMVVAALRAGRRVLSVHIAHPDEAPRDDQVAAGHSIVYPGAGLVVVPVAIEYRPLPVLALPLDDRALERGGRGTVEAVHLQILAEAEVIAAAVDRIHQVARS